MKFKIRHVTEKLLRVIPAIIEIGIMSIKTKPKDVSKMVDDKVKDFLEKPRVKGKETQQLPLEKKHIVYHEIAEEQNANVMLSEYYNERFTEKENETTKHQFIQRLHDLDRIKNMNRELDLEK